LRVQATTSPSSVEVTTDGIGVVGPAGAALLRELADRVGLTRTLAGGSSSGPARILTGWPGCAPPAPMPAPAPGQPAC
jgi:hypothetical protein